MAWVPELDTNLPLSVSRKLHWFCGAGDRAGTASQEMEPVLLSERVRITPHNVFYFAPRQAMHSAPSSQP